MKASFGPTARSLAELQEVSHADWIQAQVALPVGSHREFYRLWVNSRLAGFNGENVSTFATPCSKGSRWYNFAITREDIGKQLTVQSGSIIIDGEFRTEIDPSFIGNGLGIPDACTDVRLSNWIDNGWTCSYMVTIHSCEMQGEWWSANSVVGDKLCQQTCFDEGFPYLGDDCSPGWSSATLEGYSGTICMFRSEEVGGVVLLSAPGQSCHEDTNFAMLNPAIWLQVPPDATELDFNAVRDGVVVLAGDATEGECGLKANELMQFDGKLYRFDRRLQLRSNTIESPTALISDNGGCNLIAPTPFNEDFCLVVPGCTPTITGIGVFKLSKENLATFYSIGGKYVYVVTGLRTSDSPCGSLSRWKKLDCALDSCNETALAIADRNAIISALSIEGQSGILDINVACSGVPANAVVQVVTGAFWQHVHRHEFSVFDFSDWVGIHPGGSEAITKWAEQGTFELAFPSWHGMDRWEEGDAPTVLVKLGDVNETISFDSLPTGLKLPELEEALGSGTLEYNYGFVCGSPGEVANDPAKGHMMPFVVDRDSSLHDDIYDFPYIASWKPEWFYDLGTWFGKYAAWWSKAVSGEDQLRQRMAFALSQIVVTSTAGIGDAMFSEFFIACYDIYVRNALGNYRDLLKEMTFNPTMGQFLSFHGSRSLDSSGTYPDENYAREIMQLFTIGLWELDLDGTRVTDEAGNHVPTYTNDHVETFAKVFTGFDRQTPRPNMETHQVQNNKNRVDPFRMVSTWHDIYPKADLSGGYLGDGYPLCSELPANVAHRAGATYIFLGDAHDGPHVVVLNESSPLFSALCGSEDPSKCDFAYKLVLQSDLPCHGSECEELLQVVRVGKVHFERVAPTCVNYFFYNGHVSMRGHAHFAWGLQCENPSATVAGTSCCRGCSDERNGWLITINKTCEHLVTTNRLHFCLEQNYIDNNWCRATCYFGGYGFPGVVCPDVVYREQRVCLYPHEYVSYHTAEKRCAKLGLEVCNAHTQEATCGFDIHKQVWDAAVCQTSVEVLPSGKVASQTDSKTMQNPVIVIWKNGAYPQLQSDGACPESCAVKEATSSCVCNITVAVVPIFNAVPTREEFQAKLKVTAFSPDMACSQNCDGEVRAYLPSGSFDESTVFELNGRFFKNAESTVRVGNFSFRNAPVFMKPGNPTERDAVAEVDSLLDHLVYHHNTPPYVSTRLIQRLTSSNPSSAYIHDVAEAFRTGAFNGTVYSGRWGDLAATAAAILLHPEAGQADEDGTGGGALREPVVKIAHLLRAMEYREFRGEDLPLLLFDVSDDIGQFPYRSRTVFNFFRFDYEPPFFPNGVTGPEFEIMTSPFTVGFLNGIHAAIDRGLDIFDGGFGPPARGTAGELAWAPADEENLTATLAELDILLTGGRMAPETLEVVRTAYESAGQGDQLKAAQRTIVMSPEFNTLGPSKTAGKREPEAPPEENEPRSYKAIVFLYLDGGADTFNLLVPFDEACHLYDEYHEARTEAALQPDQLLDISAAGQACSKFAVHYKLPVLKQLYESGEAAFVVNVGSLSQPLTKDEYYRGPPSSKCLGLFSHSDQIMAAQTLKCQERGAGSRGGGGRIADALASGSQKFSTESFSIAGTATWAQGFQTDQEIVHWSYGAVPMHHYVPMGATIANLTSLRRNNMFSEGYTIQLAKNVDAAASLKGHLDASNVATTFPNTQIGGQLKQVAALMSVRERRKVERDLFYVSLGGFDTHADLHEDTSALFGALDAALSSFVTEVRAQGLFDSVTLVSSSDFGRTLSSNGAGTDHGWAGNYFVLGGSLNGGKIYGDFPSSLLPDSEQDVGRGRLLPKYPWESVLLPIAEWMGVETVQHSQVFPNIGNFNMSSHIFSTSALFRS